MRPTSFAFQVVEAAKGMPGTTKAPAGQALALKQGRLRGLQNRPLNLVVLTVNPNNKSGSPKKNWMFKGFVSSNYF